MSDFLTTIPALRGPVPLSHLLLPSFVHDGKHAVDATCGNGNDTVLLARLVGTSGHVWGFDIQQQALAETGSKLTKAGLDGRVTLLHTGHEELARHLAVPVHAVLFNLGYLPGGDRSVITLPDTTASALEQALQLLAPGGVVMVTVYPGHNGGSDEQAAVEAWAESLNPKIYHSWRMGQANVSETAPYLLLVQKAL
ncbi:MAG: rRNA methyltransferase [Geobacteraceae bacterium GWC2_53_11]|nr:MAG: rRNA methyltransferase [Geobacteraceae bacterium GWC2_53_11]